MKSLFVHGLNNGLNHGIPRGKSPDLPQIPRTKELLESGPPLIIAAPGLEQMGDLAREPKMFA